MAEYIKVPAGVYDMVTRCMEQEFPDHVAIRYVAEDGKTVVEKKYREYAQDIRRMTAYLKAEVPDIKGRRIVLLSRNCYEFCVASFGIILAGGVLVTLNQKKTWEELEYELGLVEPALILNDGIDYGCRAELEAAYGPKLRPMDCYKDTVPGELTEDSVVILQLLYSNFDPLSEQIPDIEEIAHYIQNKWVLVYKLEHKIVGFIIFELTGLTLYLRYWFVLPQFREMNIGSKLFNSFMYEGRNTKRQLLWVITHNINAIKRYVHYGFKPEKLFDYVLKLK